MLQDLKYALRNLLRTRGWTAVVLLSLMLGIGANTALFTAVNGTLLQTLAVAEPASLVRLKWAGDNDMTRGSSEYGFNEPHEGRNVRATFSLAVFEAMRQANHTMTDLAAAAPVGSLNVVIDGEADIASSFGVTGSYFQVLGLRAVLGRTLTGGDDEPGAPAAAVISHAFWRRRFGSDPNVAGRVVTVNGQPVTIVGVTPASFGGIQRLAAQAPDVTLPVRLDSAINVSQRRLVEPTYWWVHVLGRLRPGATFDQVRGNLEGVFQEAARAGMRAYMDGLTPEQRGLATNQRRGNRVPDLLVTSGAHGVYDFDRNSARSATMLAVVVVIVLLIVCANVANLLLSRATARRKELSVRLSMGATRGRLVRQLLTESLLLSGLGGTLGVLAAYWSRELVPFGQTAPIDWRVFAFVAGLSLLTGVAFGLVPALRATRLDLAGVMKEQSRSVSGARSVLSKALLVVQVALSVVLLVGAGLFLRTLYNLRTVDVGFNPHNLLMFTINPQLNRYDDERTRQIYRQLGADLGALPGVRDVAFTRVALLSGSRSTTVAHVPGRTSTEIHVMSVTPRFFATMEIPLTHGRDFSDRDVSGAPNVAILNETAARTLFPGASPVGNRFGFSPEQNRDVEVVGVIRDTKYSSVRDAAPPTVYQPFLQGTPRGMTAVLRTAVDPNSLVDEVRATVRQVDTNLPLTNVTTQSRQVEQRFAQERLFANAYTLFGALALTLACIGLFGLMSYGVSRRTNEIGIRLALGAGRPRVIRMVLGESLVLVGAGIGVGLAAAFAAGRFVASVLFGLAPTDPATMAVTIVLIVAVGVLAAYAPARRAARVDPMVALRAD
jgi:predicted permease